MSEKRYMVWFEGDSEEQPTPCYDGRHVFWTKSLEYAKNFLESMRENFPEGIYKLVTVEDCDE